MNDRFLALLKKYEGVGIPKGSLTLFKAEDAIQVAEAIAANGLTILGLELWYYVEHDGQQYIAEEIQAPDFCDLSREVDSAQKSFFAARDYLTTHLPQHISLVSFVVA